jgi:hypothetical protein
MGGQRGPVEGIFTEPLMLDVSLASKARFELEVPSNHSSFLYAFDGSVEVGEKQLGIERGRLGVLTYGEKIQVASENGGRFLLLAARALNESVARHGPFVMNTREELVQAFDDYQNGRLVRK